MQKMICLLYFCLTLLCLTSEAQTSCFGIQSISDAACNSNGVCVGQDLCECSVFSSGKNCDVMENTFSDEVVITTSPPQGWEDNAFYFEDISFEDTTVVCKNTTLMAAGRLSISNSELFVDPESVINGRDLVLNRSMFSVNVSLLDSASEGIVLENDIVILETSIVIKVSEEESFEDEKLIIPVGNAIDGEFTSVTFLRSNDEITEEYEIKYVDEEGIYVIRKDVPVSNDFVVIVVVVAVTLLVVIILVGFAISRPKGECSLMDV